MFRRVIIPMVFILVLGFFLSISTQIEAEEGLKKTELAPVIDGVIKPGEYSLSIDLNQIKLFLNRTSESLSLGLIAETEGWVGIGFRSKVMNNAEIILGYVTEGKGYIYHHLARGRSHTEVKLDYVRASEIRESAGNTVLEVELSAKELIKSGQKVFPLIVAFGKDDSLTKYHQERRGLEIKLLD